MSASKKPSVVRGEVVHARVRRGTASEHTAVVLKTDDGEELILQRLGANPFSDPESDKLAGQRVAVEGYRVGRVFRYTSALPEKARQTPHQTK